MGGAVVSLMATSLPPAGGGGGFPVVQSITPSLFGTDTTSHAVAMPAVAPAGRLLFVAGTARVSAASAAFATPVGWTKLTEESPGSAQATTHALFYKVADGSEAGGTVNFTTGLAAHAAFQVWCISGASGVPAWNSLNAGSSTSVNPPNLASGFSGNVLWLCGFGSNGSAAPSAWPTDFNDNQTTTASGGTNVCRVIACSRNSAVGTINPDPFTMGANTNSLSWTVAVSP